MNRPGDVKCLPGLALCVLLLLPGGGISAQSSTPAWAGSWAASQQAPEAQNALPPDDVRDVTLRQIFHLSIGGAAVRVHISNAFGHEPLHFTAVHLARPLSPSSAQIDPASDRALAFSGASDVIVPAGAEYISDPVEYPVPALASLAVTLHLDAAPVGQTGHPGSRATSYYVHGNHVASADLAGARHVDHWYQVSAIDVRGSSPPISIVVLGDSITDGHGATTNGNDRWTDVLAERLQTSPDTRNVGVLNQGIGGNHLLIDGLGPNALARFDRDVLAQTGVVAVIVLEGVNDLGGLSRDGDVTAAAHLAFVHRILGAYEQLIVRAHAANLRIYGATILPFAGSDYYHPPAATDADRQAINGWIRAPGHFDGVIDFDKTMQDPQQQDRLRPDYDGGDHLHPSPKGYRAMGEAVPLGLFSAQTAANPAGSGGSGTTASPPEEPK